MMCGSYVAKRSHLSIWLRGPFSRQVEKFYYKIFQKILKIFLLHSIFQTENWEILWNIRTDFVASEKLMKKMRNLLKIFTSSNISLTFSLASDVLFFSLHKIFSPISIGIVCNFLKAADMKYFVGESEF